MFGEKPAKEEEKKEETITFTPGPGVTAIVHEQNDNTNDESNGEMIDESNDEIIDEINDEEEIGFDDVDVAVDPEEDTLIALWRMYKENNPEGNLDDFYKNVLATNSEVE